MKRLALLPIPVLSVLLSACPAASNPPQATVRQLGVVSVGITRLDNEDHEVYGAAGFFLPVKRSLESLERVRDRCVVNDSPPLLEDEVFATLLDAGESIDLESGGQPFIPLGRVTFMGGGYGYTAGEFVAPIPLPDRELSADVPGAAFPAFAGVAFPAPPPPVELTSAEPTITLTPDGSFTWTPHRPEGGVSFIAFSVAPGDLETVPYAQASCIAADDGTFSFPPETRAELRRITADFEGVLSTPKRSVYGIVAEGDAALAVGLGNAGDVFEVLLQQ